MSTSLAKENLIKEYSEFISWAGTKFGPEFTNRDGYGEFMNAETRLAWAGWLAKAERVPSRITMARMERFALWFTFAYISTQITYNIINMTR